jgi:hypothetical protein
MNCSRAKCRCVLRSEVSGCERCQRLNKPCTPGSFTRKHNLQKNNAIARIAQLEGKLDGLADLLRPGSVLDTHVPRAGPLSISGSESSSLVSSGLTSTSSSSFGSQPSIFEPSNEEAEECLSTFRNHMLKYFPFLHLSPDVQMLRQERPFLLLCIVASSSQSTQRKLTLEKEVKRVLAQRLILNNDGPFNVDLLLGLLTFLCWSHVGFLHNTPTSLSRFAQLAVAVVFELRLNKPSSKGPCILPGRNLPGPVSTSIRTPEEARAVLACFALSSMYVFTPRQRHQRSLR